MSDQELLSAISNIVEEKIEPLKQDIRSLKEDVSVLKEDVSVLKEDVSVLKEDVSGLKEDVSVLKEDVSGLKKDVNSLTGRMDSLEKKVDSLTGRMDSLEKEVRRNSILIENDVLPRLQTIEKLYVDSSKIYMEKAAQIDSMQDDIDVMKVVIQEHSENLEKIS